MCLEIWQEMLARDCAWPKNMGAELEGLVGGGGGGADSAGSD